VSYTVPKPERPPRPGVVTAAVWLLYLAALGWLAYGVTTILTHGARVELYRQLNADEQNLQGTENASAIAATAIMLVPAVLFCVGLIVLAAFNGRGKNPARITTWVVGGAAACCAGYNTLGAALSNVAMGSTSSIAGVDVGEVRRLQNELMPSWLVPAQVTIGAVQIIALLIVVVLLMLPAANRFFRRQPPAWEPPVPAYPPPYNLPPQQ